MGSYRFAATCVSCGDGDEINRMKDEARQVTRKTFMRYACREDRESIERELGYKRGELTMAADWHVSYYRSRYMDRPCVYFCWSAIEHIFTPIQG